MKKFFGMILSSILVMSLFACGGSEPEDTTPVTYTAGTYAMESYTKNGELGLWPSLQFEWTNAAVT